MLALCYTAPVRDQGTKSVCGKCLTLLTKDCLLIPPFESCAERDLMSDDTNGNFSNVQLDQMSMECLM